MLNKMGAHIEGAGTPTIRVKGVSKLHGARHRIIPDRIEAATFIIAGALTGGDLNVAGCDPRHLDALLQKLDEAGVKTAHNADSLRVMGDGPLKAADIVTAEYPGFPTDMQAQYMVLATQAEGTSNITENIFPLRCWLPTCARPPRWCWQHWSRKANPLSTACITSTAATNTSKKNYAASAHKFAASGKCFPSGRWLQQYALKATRVSGVRFRFLVLRARRDQSPSVA